MFDATRSPSAPRSLAAHRRQAFLILALSSTFALALPATTWADFPDEASLAPTEAPTSEDEADANQAWVATRPAQVDVPWWVAAAYAAICLCIMLYLLALTRRIRSVEHQGAALEASLSALRSPPAPTPQDPT